MEREEIRKIIEMLKKIAPDGVHLHQKYSWGGFLDVVEKKTAKK